MTEYRCACGKVSKTMRGFSNHHIKVHAKPRPEVEKP